MTRRLHVTTRSVPREDRRYDPLWRAVVAAVTALRGNAWRFRDGERGERHIEFIEWTSDDPLPDTPEVAAARAALDACGPVETCETWEEEP